MSEQQKPLTAEVIFEMFREVREQFREVREQMKETDRKFQETDRKFQETDRKFQEDRERQKKTDEQIKKTSREVGALGSRIGEIIEYMVGGDIVEQFQTLGIEITSLCRYKQFGKRGTGKSGEIDVLLENGDLVVLIEVKTKPTDDDIRKHIERMEKYRLYGNEKRRILGAVAGGVVSDNVVEFAHEQGLYVIVQSGEAVEIVPPPEGFVAKEW